jgi:hypothetical protein
LSLNDSTQFKMRVYILKRHCPGSHRSVGNLKKLMSGRDRLRLLQFTVVYRPKLPSKDFAAYFNHPYIPRDKTSYAVSPGTNPIQ